MAAIEKEIRNIRFNVSWSQTRSNIPSFWTKENSSWGYGNQWSQDTKSIIPLCTNRGSLINSQLICGENFDKEIVARGIYFTNSAFCFWFPGPLPYCKCFDSNTSTYDFHWVLSWAIWSRSIVKIFQSMSILHLFGLALSIFLFTLQHRSVWLLRKD